MDETLALLAMIPVIGYFFRKLHVWWHEKISHTCHEKHCDETHAEHPEFQFSPNSPYHPDNWHKPVIVSDQDMEYLRRAPAPLKITIPVTIWDSIEQEDVAERFGNDLVIFLYAELEDAGLTNISKEEVHWYINDKAELQVEVRDKIFLHDYQTCEYGWRMA